MSKLHIRPVGSNSKHVEVETVEDIGGSSEEIDLPSNFTVGQYDGEEWKRIHIDEEDDNLDKLFPLIGKVLKGIRFRW